MATKTVTDENFEVEVVKSKSPCVVDFWAEWCGPCKQIGPILEEISALANTIPYEILTNLNERLPRIYCNE